MKDEIVDGIPAADWKENLQKHARTEIELNRLSDQVLHLTERIPEKFGETLVGMKMLMDQVSVDLKELKREFEKDYVSRTEFEVMKVEHDQMKKLMWGFVALVLFVVVGGLLTLIVKGQPVITP